MVEMLVATTDTVVSEEMEVVGGLLTCQIEGGKETSQQSQGDDDPLPRRAELAIARRDD